MSEEENGSDDAGSAAEIDSPVGAPADLGARCAVHPGATSSGVCSHCGNFGCDDCLGWLEGRLVCRTCVTEKRVATYDGVPWERREQLGLWTAMWRTVSDVTTKPGKLFAALDPRGTVQEPVKFLVLALVPAAALWALLFAGVVAATGLSGGSPGEAVGAAVAILLLVPFFLPAFFVALTLVTGSIHHGILRLAGGGGQGYQATLRASLYGAGVTFWIVIPCVYYVVGYWQMAMNIIGYAAVHKEPHWKGIIAVLGPIVLCCGGYLLLVLMMAAAGEL
jgi:hypothetical protein